MKPRKIKVPIIEPVGGHGGMNYYNNGLASGIIKNGGEVLLFTCDETAESSEPCFEIAKVFRRIYGKTSKIARAMRYTKGLFESIWQIKCNNAHFSHIHLFQYGLLELITCIALRAARVHIIATIHDVEAFTTEKGSFWQKTIFKLCSEFIVHNKYSEKVLSNSLALMKIRTSITVIPHGNYIDLINRKNKTDSRKNLQVEEAAKLVVFFGQIKKVKGLDVLIDAIPEILEKRPDAIFLIAGRTWKDSFEKYQRQIQALGIGESVITHIRYIPDEQVDDYYCAADVIALPYRKIYQSGVLLMAMSYGCCTVSSGLEPMREIIQDGENGYLFAPDSATSLARKIVEALNADNGRIGDAAIETMQLKHNWELVGRKHMELYLRHA